MNFSRLNFRVSRPMIAMCNILLLILLAGAPLSYGSSEKEPLSPAEIHKLGERMYREGILPSGEPMQAYVSGDVQVEGTAFTCVSCHLRSGIGSFEANIATPPTTGSILYQSRTTHKEGYEYVPSYHKYALYFPERPAYTDESLAELIIGGVDPTGRSVLDVMPRYDMSDQDMKILIAYLKTLSDQLSPGVSDTEIKFATVIAEGVAPAEVEAMLVPMEFNIGRKNSQAATYGNNPRLARTAYNMLGPDLAKRKFSLARWVLKGSPDTWRAQLDEYYRAEPVFALLGGITGGEWQPVHQFCEENRIPDLFPLTDYPVISTNDWYTLYFSRGVRQEGEAAARYLHGMSDLFAGQAIVQISRDTRKGNALADGFRQIWESTGHPAAAADIILKEGEQLSPERLQQIVAEKKPAVLMVWDDATLFDALDGLTGMENRPKMVIASGTYLGKAINTIPERHRDLLYLTYPYRLPQEEGRFDPTVKSVLLQKPLDTFDQRIVRQSFIVNEVLNAALREMRGEYFRDYLLDVIGMMADAVYPLYERMGFGPGQRYASKGCYIVQLTKGENPQIERRSEWVTL